MLLIKKFILEVNKSQRHEKSLPRTSIDKLNEACLIFEYVDNISDSITPLFFSVLHPLVLLKISNPDVKESALAISF